MKTSVIEVDDMLAVWSVTEVEQRIGEDTGVVSVTVNRATGTATVRYDETRLGAADIKSAMRQRGHESQAALRGPPANPAARVPVTPFAVAFNPRGAPAPATTTTVAVASLQLGITKIASISTASDEVMQVESGSAVSFRRPERSAG